jgi:hypothetical protein
MTNLAQLRPNDPPSNLRSGTASGLTRAAACARLGYAFSAGAAAMSLITASCSGCAAATPAAKQLGIDVCATQLARLPAVAREADRVGMDAVQFARLGCQTGVLIGEAVETFLRQQRSCSATPGAGGGTP